MASEWTTASLADIYDFSSGLSKPRAAFGSGFPFLSFKDVFHNSAVPKQLVELVESTEKERDKGSIRRGDVFLTRTSETMDELGMSATALEDIPSATFNGFTKRLRPRSSHQIAPEFARYFFRSPEFRQQVYAMSSLSTRASLNNEMLAKLSITFPTYSEQESIGLTLGAFDDRINNLSQTNATLEAIAKALFKSWFVDFDPVRAKAEGREPEGMDAATADLFPDTFKASRLGLIPEGWEVSNLGDQLEILSGGTPKTKIPEYWDGDIPWFSVVDAPKEGQVFVFDTERRITHSGLENSPARLLPANTTIISARGTVGKLAVTGQPMAMNQSCYGLRPADGVGEFLTYLSVQHFVEDLQRIAHGAVFDTITRSSFSQAQAVNAPKEVVSAFEALATPFMDRLHVNGRQVIALAKLRDTLLPRLISGKLRLPEAERDLEAATE